LADTTEGLMARTSLGNQKVGPMKSWAIRAGLVSGNYLSGRNCSRKDVYLESNITEWLMHYLSFGDKGLQSPPDDPAQWGGWSYFVYTFLPQHSTFTATICCITVPSFSTRKSQNLLKKFKFVLRAYTESQALASCKFLTLEEDQYGYVRLPNPT